MRRFAFLTLLVAAGACGTEPERLVPTSGQIEPANPQVEVGATITLRVAVRDQHGAPLATSPATWQSTDDRTATVSSGGVVTGVSAGTATVTATTGPIATRTTIVVTPLPVAQVRITGAPASMRVAESTPLTAAALDRTGAEVVGRQVTWTTSTPTVVDVTAPGVVRAVAPGTAIVAASIDGITAAVSFAVLPAGVGPTIASVAPATLVPGTVATIAGAGFDPALARNVVTVGGVSAQVTSASATTLTIVVPCVATGAPEIRVTTNGATGAGRAHPLLAPRRAIAVGQAFVATSAAAASCTELAPSAGAARYLVAVFNGSGSVNSLVDAELHGNPGDPIASTVTEPAGAWRAGVPRRSDGDVESPDERRDRMHLAHLQREEALYAELRAAGRRGGAIAGRAMRSRAPLPAVGDARAMFYTFNGGCTDTTRVVRGRAIYVGTRAIIWEDSANVLQSSTAPVLADYYARLGRIFDEEQYEVVRATFGDPLRRDPLTDGDGRVHMVFTQRLNGSGAAAFVTGCDQQPRARFAGSNEGEFFYAMVPTTEARNPESTASPDGWFSFMGRTVVHEVKHIASVAARLANDAPVGEVSWLEEGTARHAEEVWVRQTPHRSPWKGNAGWLASPTNGLYCDFHGEDAQCTATDVLRRPGYGMRRHFNEIRDKLVAPWAWSPYGTGTGQTGSVFYQTAWSLVRYAIDRYGASDAAFLTALTSASTNGTTSLATVAGVSLDQLVGGWSLALYADDYPGLASPGVDLQFPTWNLRSIYAGLNADRSWGSRFPTPFPIVPAQQRFGSFVVRQDGIRGGASAYVEIAGSALGPQVLALRGVGGAPAGSTVRIAIARLQ